MRRRALFLVVAIAACAAAVAVGRTSAGATTKVPVAGRGLYREYCGKCHALKVALAAGFGTKANPLAGPSFDNLRVPYKYSIQAVTEPTGGHELLSRKINPKQLNLVATYIAKVTARHLVPALPTDG
jgi:mono/diheme cytochrome c family protein